MSWPPNSLPGFIFVALVPVLWLVFNFDQHKRKFATWSLFGYLFFTFFCINFSLTSWLMNAHWGGGLFASIFNASLMSLVFVFVYKLKKQMGDKHAYLAFSILWLAFEYLHLNWEMTWPWMSLGNVFAEKTTWIQWYEYTGVLGGSLWVLLINSLIYYYLSRVIVGRTVFKPVVFILAFLFIPLWKSSKLAEDFDINSGDQVNVVIVQPNYDPHFEKFKIPQQLQLQRVEGLLDSVWKTSPDLIVLPETFITEWIWESRIESSPVIERMKLWLSENPETQILTGASTGKVLNDVDNLKSTARRSQGGTWYEVFNTALLISTDKPTQIFHKSKLVPGAEMTPFSSILKPVFENFPIELGGTIGNFGVNDSMFNLTTHQGDIVSMICYESVFGAYVSEFVNRGADWICIITNDGWWKETYGHQQHNAYARLRAIENRRFVVRSANTGISSVINPFGTVEQFLPYGESGIIEASIIKSGKLSFYSKYGDYIGRLASFLAIIYLLQLILTYLKNDKIDLKI
jgi:apolipoprotein N-acyltransferase